MKKLRVLGIAVGSVAVALMLTSCESKTTVNNQPTETSGITVSGHGEVQVPPDIGYVTVGVQVTAASVADARDQAADSATALISSIKKNGVADKDIQTTGLSIYPNYDYSKSSPKLTGYTVTNTVTAKVRKLENLSKVVDEAVTAGGNAVRLQSLSFGIDDELKAKKEAREKAMADAKTKAEELAKLGGVSLGAPVTIAENQSYGGGAKDIASAPTTGGGVSTPIETGTNTVTVDVSVRWALK